MIAAFDRLAPALQYQIVNALGFRDLRPVQELAIEAIAGGKNSIILAPTAGGKTEAAMFPLLSGMELGDWRPVSVVYVAPIRALLNNQEERLARYAALIGRRAFVWHGDVPASRKRAFCRDPADLLLTTPESLEVMLMSRNVPARALFAALRAVVIDEVHAFVGDDRGGHLAALLERLSRYAGRDVQRIGLSATVGNPDDILAWAAGSSTRDGVVVRPPGTAAAPELSVDFVGNEANAARVIAALHPGRKRLVFVDSRRGVEALGQHLGAAGVNVHVTHSSLSADARQLAEAAFARDRDCVIVATSALELGIDIGDLDHVIQIDAPATVASFLQRMGRTGRRSGTIANCTFLTTTDDTLVRAAAIVHLYRRGYIEPVRVRRRATHLLAHQIMALCIQEQGVPVSDWWAWIAPATPFGRITEGDRQALVEHMLAQDILCQSAARLNLGARGEKLYGFRNFADLYAVFQAVRTLTVLWAGREIGSIDASFAEQQDPGNFGFTLGARAWRATSIDWSASAVHVVPADKSGMARWHGRPELLERPLCQAMRAVLTGSEHDPAWSRRARHRLDELRSVYAWLPPGSDATGGQRGLARARLDSGLDLVPDPGGYRLWTFAGGRANNLLARVLESELGSRITVENRYLGFRDEAGQSAAAICQALAHLREQNRPTEADGLMLAQSCARGRLSKFQPCLPEALEAAYLADALTDTATARAVAAEPVRVHDSAGPGDT